MMKKYVQGFHHHMFLHFLNSLQIAPYRTAQLKQVLDVCYGTGSFGLICLAIAESRGQDNFKYYGMCGHTYNQQHNDTRQHRTNS